MSDPTPNAATPTLNDLLTALAPVVALAKTLDLKAAGEARQALTAAFPVDGATWQTLKSLFVVGREAGWLCQKENGGVKFSRPKKADAAVIDDVTVDAVHMHGPGPGHTHNSGEVDLCFAVDGDPRFDGKPEGIVVYPPGSWHVPTVTGGTMDILYLLPQGAITFEDKPR